MIQSYWSRAKEKEAKRPKLVVLGKTLWLVAFEIGENWCTSKDASFIDNFLTWKWGSDPEPLFCSTKLESEAATFSQYLSCLGSTSRRSPVSKSFFQSARKKCVAVWGSPSYSVSPSALQDSCSLSTLYMSRLRSVEIGTLLWKHSGL